MTYNRINEKPVSIPLEKHMIVDSDVYVVYSKYIWQKNTIVSCSVNIEVVRIALTIHIPNYRILSVLFFHIIVHIYLDGMITYMSIMDTFIKYRLSLIYGNGRLGKYSSTSVRMCKRFPHVYLRTSDNRNSCNISFMCRLSWQKAMIYTNVRIFAECSQPLSNGEWCGIYKMSYKKYQQIKKISQNFFCY